MNEELELMKKRNVEMGKERDSANSRILLLEQINSELKIKEAEYGQTYEEMMNEMKDKLERKELFIQNKEKKWIEVEKILEEYLEDDEELKDKLF
mmetsp:Transcript_22325/g.21526  ORF Transcript_22325/g.21526 Transcript_22325/m.21526 type:complete len:95 (-) Transcript_22325:577-861(-)